MDHHDPAVVAFQPFLERVAQNVLGVTLVDAKAAEIAIFHQHPADMRPEEVYQGTVGIGLSVGMLVMAAMDRHPTGGRVLHAANADDGKDTLHPTRAGET